MSFKSIPDEIQRDFDQSFAKIDTYFKQIDNKKHKKISEIDVIRELKKIKALLNNNKDKIGQQARKNISNREKDYKAKIKPKILLTNEERTQYRDQILAVVKSLQKQLLTLAQKKDNKKRQKKIQFLKQHQTKLNSFADWLMSSSRQFSVQHMKSLVKYLKDIHLSHQDAVFQDQIEGIYQKIAFFAQQPQQLTSQMFLSSFENRPRLNDYLPSKLTKQTICRNSICPHYKMIDLSVMPKMSKELLFFMFYYHKGETEQYLAAQQLMKNSWRYYKKFNLWLKRVSQPTFDGDDHETGNYISVGADLIKKQRKGIKVFHKYLIQQL